MSYHKSLGGVGWVSLVPSGSYPDPVHLAEIDSIDFSTNEETADLENSEGDVIDSFPTKRVVEGTITLKDVSNSLLACVTRGVTVATGQTIGYAQTSTVPTTPFQVTVTQSATFVEDLGVINLTNGTAMTSAATATGTGVYAVSAGVYTFHTDDAGDSVLINYRATTTSGTTATVAAAAAGTAQAKFGLHCYKTVAGKSWGIYVPQALLPGLSAKFSKSGWSDATVKFKATLDTSGNLFYLYAPE